MKNKKEQHPPNSRWNPRPNIIMKICTGLLLTVILLFAGNFQESFIISQENNTLETATEPDIMAQGEVTIQGMTLQIDPAIQTVPINTATIVNTQFSVDTPGMVAGMVVKAELSGPGLNEPVTLSTLPNHPFSIPPLAIKGEYFLDNIRIERDGVTLMPAQPNQARLDVMDVVVTRIETRQLTLDEIREKGIVITDDNFS